MANVGGFRYKALSKYDDEYCYSTSWLLVMSGRAKEVSRRHKGKDTAGIMAAGRNRNGSVRTVLQCT